LVPEASRDTSSGTFDKKMSATTNPHRERIERFFESVDMLHGTHPRVPEDMRVPGSLPNSSGWMEWHIIPSRVSDTDLDNLEKDLPAKLPAIYRAYLSTYHIIDSDFGDWWLPELPSDRPLFRASQYLHQKDLWELDLMQIGSNPFGDPVCLDLRSKREDGDYRIVNIPHDCIPREAWQSRETLEPHLQHLADSFYDFLDVIENK
jgi:hypothetical protein